MQICLKTDKKGTIFREIQTWQKSCTGRERLKCENPVRAGRQREGPWGYPVSPVAVHIESRRWIQAVGGGGSPVDWIL